MAQPSLSQMLKELEEDMGAEVFLRGKSGVEESPFGTELLNRLEEVGNLFTQMRIELEEFQQMKKRNHYLRHSAESGDISSPPDYPCIPGTLSRDPDTDQREQFPRSGADDDWKEN